MSLIIVESPAKAKKIQSFLKNENITVRSSFGHINGLDTTKLQTMIDKGFEPIYKNTNNKAIQSLKSVKCNRIILAADDDREGDAIAWHTGNLFKLDYTQNNRIKFNEISKRAIENALDNPERLNLNSVNAQRTRQFIDLMIGYKLSPLLWKHIQTDKRGLSAGRVQSCLLHILYEHETKIKNHKPEYSYKMNTELNHDDINLNSEFQFEKRDITDDTIKEIMNYIINERDCIVTNREKTEVKQYSQPPLITSTLQQSAQSELGFPVKMTMNIAQKLYENGKITYHRTDSTFISDDFKKTLQKEIVENYGKEYYMNRAVKKVNGSQEAHECIRPTNLKTNLDDRYNPVDIKLYNMIRDKTVMSHMKPAIFDVLTLQCTNDLLKDYGYFKTQIKSMKFDGYLKYLGKSEEPVDFTTYENIDKFKLRDSICRYLESNPPQHYNESTIVKKLEKSGIGRPSTYASLIDTLYNRNYTVNTDIPERERDQKLIQLIDDDISEKNEKVKIKKESKRIVVTELGQQVLEYLAKNFIDVLNIQFTALVERDLDLISSGDIDWKTVIKKVYDSFINIIEREMGVKTTRVKKGDNIIGKIKDESIVLKNGKFGHYFRYNDKNYSVGNYLKYKKIEVEKLKIEDCIKIVKYPRKIGSLKKKQIMIHMGPYGYYMKYDNKNIRIHQDETKWTKEYILDKLT